MMVYTLSLRVLTVYEFNELLLCRWLCCLFGFATERRGN